jgi:hypothetical protein
MTTTPQVRPTPSDLRIRALSLQASRTILKTAVMRAVFNTDGSVADIRRSVLVEVLIPATTSLAGISKGEVHAMSLYSSLDFDSLPDLRATVANLPDGSVLEVWDGRYLFGAARSASGYLKLSNINGILSETGSF